MSRFVLLLFSHVSTVRGLIVIIIIMMTGHPYFPQGSPQRRPSHKDFTQDALPGATVSFVQPWDWYQEYTIVLK